MPLTIKQDIDIAAPAATIWRVLTDFPAYGAWNPFITQIRGGLQPGSVLTVRAVLPDRRPMVFRPRLLVVAPEAELRWLGRMVLPGVFDGEHWFTVSPLAAGGCRFSQGEAFSGLMVRAIRGLAEDTGTSFRRMNAALKARAESLAGQEEPA